MSTEQQKPHSQVKASKTKRLPYTSPSLEILELRPEEQLLACDLQSPSVKKCGNGVLRKS